MKCSLGISNFLEEISSLSHSVVFLYFFALISEEGFLISSCYSLELCIKKRWQEYTEELHKKDLHDQDNHDGVITHLGSDILECEVKCALGSITPNKASGGDVIPTELFQILKDDAVKVLHSICQQIWKTQEWQQDWQRPIFIPIPKRQCQRMFKLPHNCTHLTH